MNIQDRKSFWLPNGYNADSNNPKFLYRVDYKIPEEAFQYGFEIDELNFDFYKYYFNHYFVQENNSRKFINAYETIQEALINFRKDLNYQNNSEIKDLYLYVIRADQNFYNKEVTRNSISTAINDERLKVKDEEKLKIIFAFNQFGNKYNNFLEWFTTYKISNEQIFSASQIKIDFLKINNSRKNKDVLATCDVINLEFRNPNYIDLNTNGNDKSFWFPEPNAQLEMNFLNDAFYFHSPYFNAITKKEIYLKSFQCENVLEKIPQLFVSNKLIEQKPIVKNFHYIKEKNRKKEIITNFYQENILNIFDYSYKNKTYQYFFKNKKIKLFFSYSKDPNKQVYLDISTNKKRGNVFFKSKKNGITFTKTLFLDKRGRFIFEFQDNTNVPYALTLTNIDLTKEYAEISSEPAVLNDENQLFHLEHAHSGIMYLKSNSSKLQNLELAIKHKNNSFVFINPKKKYNFAYDLVNINLSKYTKNNRGFIYGYENYCPENIDINLSWSWNKQFYKPNLYISKVHDLDLAEQARSTLLKSKQHIIYNLNTLRIINVDCNTNFLEKGNLFSMVNNIKDEDKYRWLEWKKDNIYRMPKLNCMWVLKRSNYNNDNLYWIYSYQNKDCLWVQQKGENWGFLFLAKNTLYPNLSSCLFHLNKNTIK